MGVFNWIKSFADIKDPVNNIIEVIDKSVTDKDLKNTLTSEIRRLELAIDKAEIDLKIHQSTISKEIRIAELKTKTNVWIDGIHKLGRIIIAITNIIVGALLIGYLASLGQQITMEVAMTVMGIGFTGGAYAVVKGKGRAIKEIFEKNKNNE